LASALQEARAGTAAQELQQWLGYRDELRRYAAARELGARREQEAVPALLRAVFSYGDVAAVEALEKIGDSSCLAPLATLFEHGGDLPRPLLDTIGRTIAGFGDAGVTALLPIANRFRGLRTLAHTRSPQAVEAVRAQLNGRLNWVAEDILIALGAMSRVSRRDVAVDYLESLARREDWQSRLQALQLLHWCVDPMQGASLLAQLRDDPDIAVRGCAQLWSS